MTDANDCTHQLPGHDGLHTGEQPVRRRRRKWPYGVGAVILVTIWCVAAAVALSSGPDAFEEAQRSCDATGSGTTIADNGKTFIVDGAGREDYDGVGVEAMSCILRSLDVPDAVTSHITATRALDGRQEDHWGQFTASWSYHPDEGLDLIVREK